MSAAKPNQENGRQAAMLSILLAVISALAYTGVRQHEFLNWDDQSYVTENDHVKGGVTSKGIIWAFTQTHSANWHPITWLSHMADVSMFGLNPLWHHATNLFFHVVNSVLLLLLLRQMTGSVWRSTMVAALFALHPLHVESVAWVAERKDVLSAFFGILTLMAYGHYVHESKGQSQKSKIWYIAALGLFALGLMSKPMLVTWPFVMLLLDVWPLGRCTPKDGGWKMEDAKPWKTWSRLIVEKIPFFALALASCVITVWAQKKGEAVASIESLPILARLTNASVAYGQYLTKFFWPQHLSPIYPLQPNVELGLASASILILASITILIWRARATSPFLLVGWLWFLGTLVPVIGIVQVGSQAYADRYTYLPLIGVMIATIWFGANLLEKLRLPKVFIGALLIFILGLLTWRTTAQILIWKNSETLFSEVLEQHPKNFQALYGLGGYLADTGRVDEAIPLLERALAAEPHSPEALGKLADLYDGKGRYTDAVLYYQTGLNTHPDHTGLLNNFAWLRAACPDATIRNGEEAVRLATRACELTRYSKPIFIGTLAAAKAEAGDFPSAIATSDHAAQLADLLQLKETARRNRELIDLYRSGKAAHGGTPQRK